MAGPYLGRENDAKIWAQTDIVAFLEENGFYVLGDKGYVGCAHVYHMKKKRKGQARLSDADKAFNKNISKFRVRVENHFADMKVWKILSHAYRGDLQKHRKIFLSCEILSLLSEDDE